MRSIRLPGKGANALGWIFTLLLTLCLTLLCLSWQVNTLLTDNGIHEAVALNSRVLDAQRTRVSEKVEQLAQEYSFQSETVMELVDEAALTQYNRQVIDWWMGLMQPDPVISAPVWDTSAVETAVREDTLFKENTAANMRRSIARDKVAYQVGLAVKRAVLPVRADILSAVLPKVMERVSLPALVRGVSILPALFGAAAGVCALVLVLLMRKRLTKAALYIGAGMGASALCALGLCGAVSLMNIQGMVGEISCLLSLQLELLGGQVLLRVGLFAAVLLLAGYGLIALHQRDMRRLCRRRGRSEA